MRRNLARASDRYMLEVDLEDLAAFKEDTAVTLRDAPDQILPLFEVRSQRGLSPLVF